MIAFGTSNGMIKDYDIKHKCTIRQAKLHKGSRVSALISQGKYLISASVDGLIVVFDYSSQQLFRELKDPRSLASPSSMLLTKGERFLIVCE